MADHYGVTEFGIKAFDWIVNGSGQLLASGVVGGIVRAATLRSTWGEAIVTAGIGGICAQYLSPLTAAIINPLLGGLNIASAPPTSMGFLTGLLGVGLTGYLIDFAKAKRTGGVP